MKNSALKKFLFSGILIWGSLAGGLLSCGKEELLAAGKEVYPQRVSINGELQWKLGFHWDYFPQSENSEKIGYFVSKEGRKKQMKEAKQQIRGTMDVLPNGKMIEVWHDRLSEEEFFGGPPIAPGTPAGLKHPPYWRTAKRCFRWHPKEAL